MPRYQPRDMKGISRRSPKVMDAPSAMRASAAYLQACAVVTGHMPRFAQLVFTSANGELKGERGGGGADGGGYGNHADGDVDLSRCATFASSAATLAISCATVVEVPAMQRSGAQNGTVALMPSMSPESVEDAVDSNSITPTPVAS